MGCVEMMLVPWVHKPRHQSIKTSAGPFSALCFGDSTVGAFKAAISLLEDGGLVAFNLKEESATGTLSTMRGWDRKGTLVVMTL